MQISCGVLLYFFLLGLPVSHLWAYEDSRTGKLPMEKNDSHICTDPKSAIDIVDEKYSVYVWPRYDEIEQCIIDLDPAIESQDIVPHPCAMHIYVKLTFSDLNSVNVAENLISLKLTYSEHWTDDRIILPPAMDPLCRPDDQLIHYMYLKPENFYRSEIWTPDFYIKGVTGRSTMSLVKDFGALVLHSDKKIENTITMNLVVMCPMNFEYYPFDTQVCNITLESYGTFYQRIAILWDVEGVEILPTFSVEGYDVTATAQKPAKIMYANYLFPQLQVTLSFRRIRIKHIILIYIPSLLHFLIAWLAFFLPKEVSQGRCIINCSTTLSLVSMLSVYTRNSPHGGYVKALDVWSYFSIFFQFLCTLDAMVDTRMLYIASNIKRNPAEAGGRNILKLVTNTANWLGKEVRLVQTRDEGTGFEETLRDMQRLSRDVRQEERGGDRESKLARAIRRRQESLAKYSYSSRYYKFLKMLVLYQEWSQYICFTWYIIFLLGYWALYVP